MESAVAAFQSHGDVLLVRDSRRRFKGEGHAPGPYTWGLQTRTNRQLFLTHFARILGLLGRGFGGPWVC